MFEPVVLARYHRFWQARIL